MMGLRVIVTPWLPASFVNKASIFVRSPGYDRALFVSDVTTGVSVVTVEFLGTDRAVNAEGMMIKFEGHGENQRKLR